MKQRRKVVSGTALCASVERRCAPQWMKPLTTHHSPLTSKGFTLVEMIMVIVITGIIGGMVAVFLKAPIQQYMDVARRADMTDIADTALRRISRDLRLALPNSVRVTGAISGAGSCNGSEICTLEFVPTKGGARYRAGAGGDELDFSSITDSTFDVLAVTGQGISIADGDSIVIYNLGITGADAYEGSSRRVAVAPFGGNLTNVSFNPAGTQFPFDSPGRRFHVVDTPVSYVCTPNSATPSLGTLVRLLGYGWAAPSGTGNLLATNVGSCSFTYDPNVVAQRSGLVTMHLAITEDGETVTLYNAAHVSNQP